MDFRRVEAALEAIGLRDQYIREFRENGLDDDTINFEDPDIVSTLKDMIPTHSHRNEFRKAFKTLLVATKNNIKNEIPGGHSVTTPSVTSSQSDGPDEEQLQATHSQDAYQPPPHHAKYVNIKALEIKGDSKIGDIDNKMLLHFGNVRKLAVSTGECSGHTSKKMKMEVQNVEFQIQDPIPSFTGREEVLEDLHKKIQEGKEQGQHMTILSQTSLISGMGGVGKTQTLRKYILTFKHHYDHIIWINAENETAMSTSLFKLADTELGISCVNDEGQRDSDEVIRENVYKNLCEKRCLMVFDNAESYDQEGGIQKFLPSTIKGTWKTPTIIVTSRIRDWEPHVVKERVIQLGGLTEAEIWQFFSKYLELDDTDENRGLSKKIGLLCEGLPLVLQQVWGLIVTEHEKRDLVGKGSYNMTDFLSEYEEGKKKYLKNKPRDSELSDSVYTIFSITFAKLLEMKNGDLALRFLRMMSFLSPSCIPKKLFSRLIQQSEENAYPDAMVMLKKYNLINVYDPHYEIHRTIQEVTVEHMKAPISASPTNMQGESEEVECDDNETVMDEILWNIMNGLDEYLPKIPPNDALKHASFTNAFCVASHAKHLCTVNGFPHFVFNLMERAKDIYYSETYALLCIMRTQLSAAMDKNPSTTSIHTRVLLQIKSRQAYVLDKMSKYDEALQLYKETISSLEDEHESDNLLEMQMSMAMTLVELGRYGEAQQLLEDLIHEELQVEDIERSRALRKILASVFMGRSRYEEALGILQPLAQELEANDCSWDSCYLIIQHDLAMALMHVDKHNEALDLLQKVILHEEQILGICHPTTLICKSNQIEIMLKMKNFQEALTLCQKLTNEVVNVLDEDHELVLSQKLLMAKALGGLGRYEEALAEAEEASMKLKRHGENRLEYLNAEIEISSLEQKLGRHERALSRLDYVIDLCKQNLGPDHHWTLSSINDKATVLWHLGKFSDAEEILREVLETEKKVFSQTHSTSWTTVRNLSAALSGQEKYRDALALANEVVIATEEVLGSDNLDTLLAKNSKATKLYALGNHREALSIFQNILPKLLEIAGNCKTQDSVLSVRMSLAAALHTTGNIAESISLFEEIINDCSEAGELDPRFLISAMKQLGSILKRAGRYNEALSLFEKAASLVESVVGALDPRSIESKLSLAEVMMIVDPSRGVKLHTDIVAACETYYGKHGGNKTEEAMRALAASFVSVGSITSMDACLSILEEKLFQGEDDGPNIEDYWMLKMKIDTAVALVKFGRNDMAFEMCMPFLEELEVSNRQTSQGNHTVLELCKGAQLSRAKILCGKINKNVHRTFPLHRQL